MKKSIEDINAIRQAMQSTIILRDNVDPEKEVHIIVYMGTCGISAGAREVFNALVDEIEQKELHGVRVTRTGCAGDCEDEPIVEVHVPGKDPEVFKHMDVNAAVKLIEQLAKLAK